MRVLITGATGLVGQEIVKQCHSKGINVSYLTTRASKISKKDNYKGFLWNVAEKEIDSSCFEGVHAIIHLAGASISKRWTESYKQEIISSRTDSTALLVETLKQIPHNVKQIVSASAIGIYPDSLTKYYDQTHNTTSTSFLGEVVELWEKAVDNFKALRIEVSKVRIGLVLSKDGGALKEIIKPMKFGLGAAFGSGKQWQSWIHVEDLARIFIYVLEAKLPGVYNGVAPNPVTNSELTQVAAKTLKKPLFLPNILKFAMQLALGEMHIILFESQRVSSKKIEDKGFDFKYHKLEAAMQQLLG